MRQPARLITPEGKAIDLPKDVYRQVKRLLDTRPARHPRVKMATAIQHGYGLLGEAYSLTQALLDEHALERARMKKAVSFKGLAMSSYVLDTFALLAYFNAEPGGIQVKSLIESAGAKQATLFISQINLGELYYIVFRKRGVQKAQETLQTLRELPVVFYEATETRILAAAELKAQYPISYADAFAAALAIERGATLVSGDPEFSALTSEINLLWLTQI